LDDSKSESSEEQENESLTHPKDHTMRTDDPVLPLKRLLMERNATSVEGLEGLLAPNLNQGRKRYRKSVENTIDNGCLERY